MSSIVVRIAGDDKELQAALTRAQKSLGQFGRQMRVGVNAAAKYSAALAAVGAAITAAFVKKHMDAIDATAKLAASLNTTTESLAGLQYAAKEGGLEGLDGALTRLNRRLGAAEFGAGAAAVTVKKLNLDLEALSKMPVDERVASIADTIRDSGLSFQQAARHLQNLGFEQKEATQLFMQGGDAFRSARKEAEALGLAFSDIDAAQVEAASTALSRIKDVITGVGNQLTIQLAPYIEEVAKQLTGLAVESGGFGSAITAALESAMRGAGFVADAFRGLHVVMKGVTLAFQGLGTGILHITSMVQEGWDRIFAMIVSGMSDAIRQVNRLPGIDISTDGLDNFARSLESNADWHVAWRESMRDSVSQTAQELHDLAMQPMPGDQVEAFLRAVRQRSREAAEEVAAARAAMRGGDGVEVDPEAEKEAERHRKEIADRIERIRQGLLTERAIELEGYAEKRAALQEAYDLDLLDMHEFLLRGQELETAHWERMAEIRRAGLTDLQRFTESSYRAQVQTVAGHLADMTAGVARENKAMFNLNKAAGISNAIVSAYEGISLTMAKYPYPLNIGMAAAHAAAAFAQVNAIRSQSFGSGSAAPSLAGGTPAQPVTPVSGGAPQQAESDIVFQLRGQSFGPDAISDIAKGLGDFIDGGGRIRHVRVEQF